MASHNGDLDKLFKPFMEWLSNGDLGFFASKNAYSKQKKNIFIQLNNIYIK